MYYLHQGIAKSLCHSSELWVLHNLLHSCIILLSVKLGNSSFSCCTLKGLLKLPRHLVEGGVFGYLFSQFLDARILELNNGDLRYIIGYQKISEDAYEHRKSIRLRLFKLAKLGKISFLLVLNPAAFSSFTSGVVAHVSNTERERRWRAHNTYLSLKKLIELKVPHAYNKRIFQ